MKRSFLLIMFLSLNLFSFGAEKDEGGQPKTCSQRIEKQCFRLARNTQSAFCCFVGVVTWTCSTCGKINKSWHKQMHGHAYSSDDEGSDNE